MVRIDQNWRADQQKPRMFVGYLPASALIRDEVFDIHRFRSGRVAAGPPSLDDGYQRDPNLSRRRQIARYVQEPYTLLPTAVLLSSRDRSLQPKFLKPAEEGDPSKVRRYVLSIDPAKMNPKDKLYIIDGQHRVFGLRYAIEELGNEEIGRMEIPVVLIDNCTYFEEVMQFAIVNKEARRVPSQLALQLARQMRHDEDRYSWILKESMKWQDTANELVRWLEDAPDSPWRGRILLPNAPADRNKSGYPKVRSFVDSLKPLVKKDAEHSAIEEGELKKFLVNYWTAIRELCPECYNKPRDYVLLKTPGVFALHKVARSVMEKVGALFGYKAYLKKDHLKALLKEMPSMKHIFWQARAPVDGTGDELAGEASKYGGMKGYGQLAELLQSHVAEAADKIASEQRASRK